LPEEFQRLDGMCSFVLLTTIPLPPKSTLTAHARQN
jgi:hypothetical protein